MSRFIAICSLAVALSPLYVAAQTPPVTKDGDVASRYAPAPTHETRTQQQRRQRAVTARQLVVQKAATRAANRDQRIATANALGISHARPAVNQYWLNSYMTVLRRLPWSAWVAPVEYPEETADPTAPQY